MSLPRPVWVRATWVFLLVLIVALAAATPSRADIGVIVLEPVSALGFFTRVEHAGTYFSNICQDGSPVKMRLCLPGEGGGVVSKYAPLSRLAPLIATAKLQSAIERYNFGPLFSSALTTANSGELPDGAMESGAGDALRPNHLRPHRRDLRHRRRDHRCGVQCCEQQVAVQFLLSQLFEPGQGDFRSDPVA